MSRRPYHRGFTLIEVLIAVLVLAIGLLGIGAVFPVVVRQQRQAQDTIQGLTARQSAEAYLRARVNTNNNTLIRDIATFVDGNSKPAEWQVPDVNLKTGVMTINGEDLPLADRLSPPPFAEVGDPQFVWDFAARRSGPNQLEVAVFVRRVDPGITLGSPSGKKYTLSHALAGDGVLAAYRRVPVGMDNTGRATLSGTPNYATLTVIDVDPIEQGAKLVLAKNTPAGLIAALRQPGQKLIDNTGVVHTVARADDVNRSAVVLEQPLPSDVLYRIETGDLELRVLATPQVPAAATVVKVSQ
ncbi:MAG: prepilin-type N-terminal cleavage/methylation domain-containing protein [Phycisphaerae bacterium]|nr:prepilin-type N-terminal cleavage/methylation domain-containing protein [Phycisphaerae bacterium]